MLNRNGVSPLIATVVLIGFVVALSATVFLWGKGYITEKAEKEGELAQKQLQCAQLAIDVVEEADGRIAVINEGSLNVDGLIIVGDGGNVLKCPEDELCGDAFPLKPLERFYVSAVGFGSGSFKIIPALKPEGANAPLVPCSEETKKVKLS